MSYSIYPIKPPNCDLPVYVSGIGYEDNQPHVMRKEGFPLPHIFLCISGTGILKVNKMEYRIEKGTMFYLAPNIPHEYDGITDRWEVEWITFNGNNLGPILKELNLDCTKVIKLSSIDKMESYYKKIMISLKASDNQGRVISSGILYTMLVEFYTFLHKTMEYEDSEGNRAITIMKDYIDLHYNETITLEELSDQIHATPQYLCRLFKKHLNIRPFQYIAMKRIQHAKILLSDSNLSINDIAHQVGYNDCSYFCAIFKKIEMISPSEFRGLRLR